MHQSNRKLLVLYLLCHCLNVCSDCFCFFFYFVHDSASVHNVVFESVFTKVVIVEKNVVVDLEHFELLIIFLHLSLQSKPSVNKRNCSIYVRPFVDFNFSIAKLNSSHCYKTRCYFELHFLLKFKTIHKHKGLWLMCIKFYVISPGCQKHSFKDNTCTCRQDYGILSSKRICMNVSIADCCHRYN